MKVSEGYCIADSRNLPKVDYMMLLQHMRENDTFNVAEIRGAKVMFSSRDSYVETSVGYVEVKRENGRCFVQGRVTPEHRVRTKMYTVLATINEIEETIVEVKCQDCAASEGGCKHAICFIMWLIKRTDEPSVTSVDCYWTQPKLNEAVTRNKCILAKELGKRVPVTVQLPNTLTLASFLEECRKKNMNLSLLSNYNFQSVSLDNYTIFKLMLDYINNLSADDVANIATFKEFVEAKVTTEVINDIEGKTHSQADSPLWHTLRQGRVTGSRIYECSKCNTDGVLVKSILGGYKIPETRAIRRGKLLEKEVIKEVEKAMNVKITKCGFKLITPLVGATPDGLCEEGGFTVEVKCPISTKTLDNYIKDGNISAKCKAQIQMQMRAMGTKKALFCIANPNFENNKSIIQHWLYYDRLYVDKMLSEAELFWEKFIFRKMIDIARD